MSLAVSLALLAPAVVLLTLIIVVAVRPQSASGLAEVLRACSEPIAAIVPWGRRTPTRTRSSEAELER
jgi:hypothetical protein